MEFTFYNPTKLIFGKGKIAEIGKEISVSGAKKILLIAGGGSIKKNTVYDQTINSLKSNNLQWVEAWDVRPNPTLEKTKEIISIAKKEQVDSILAVGGGSVIDTAKAVAAGFYVDNVWDFFEGKSIEKTLPLFTILTISATASEMDPHAVISNEQEKKKWSISTPSLFPQVSVIDPTVQFTLPWNQTAYGAADGITHVMEFYSIAKDQETTLAINDAILRTIIKTTDALKQDPKHLSARSNLAWSLTLALNGMSGAGLHGGDWSIHAIEHAISALHPKVAHGAGLAVVAPAWISYLHKYNSETFKRWAKNVWDCDSTEQALKKMKEKYSSWGLPTSLGELGVNKDEIPILADIVMKRGQPGALKQLNKNDVEEILRLAL